MMMMVISYNDDENASELQLESQGPPEMTDDEFGVGFGSTA